MRVRSLFGGVVVALFFAISSVTASPREFFGTSVELTSDQAIAMDAQAYASAFGISTDEAIRRLTLQRTISELDAQLTQKEAATFAGLWIQNSPTYRVIVCFTRNGEATIKPYVENGPLANLIEVRTTKLTLQQLQGLQSQTASLVKQLGLSVHTGISVSDNFAQVYVPDQARFTAALQNAGVNLPQSVTVIDRVTTQNTADIYGGLSLPDCTIGFAVQDRNGQRGISTAGHCSNTQSYNGVNLPLAWEVWSPPWDVQWHTAPGFNVTNLIWTGSSTRRITYERPRSLTAVGGTVCKFGKVGGYGCGRIIDLYFDNNNVRTDVLVQRGDSGGPFFYGGDAYGTVISQYYQGTQMLGSVYAPVDQLYNTMAVHVITQ